MDSVTLAVAITPEREASLSIRRGEKALKTLPPALKKNPEVIAIRESVTELSATRKCMCAALEEAMIRGDHLQLQELRDLAAHPVIAPMLRSLVWVVNEQHAGWWLEGTLDTPAGKEPIGEQALRLAHPHDLYTLSHWPALQAQVMERGVTQPFKQVLSITRSPLRSRTRNAVPATTATTSSRARPPRCSRRAAGSSCPRRACVRPGTPRA